MESIKAEVVVSSVGSGNPDQLQGVRRVAIEIRRGRGKGLSAFAHVDPGNFTWPTLRRRIFTHYRCSATSHGVLGKRLPSVATP